MTDPTTLPAFTFAPDWAEPPTLGLRFLTEILASDTGAEQRAARRRQPALATGFRATAFFDQAEARRLEQFLRAHVGQRLAVPLWTEAQPILSAAGTLITLAADATTVHRLFQPGRAVVLWRAWDHAEILNTDAVTATTITTTDPVVAAFAAGDLVAPVLVTEPITATQATDWLTAFHATGQARFDESVAEATPLPWTLDPPLAEWGGRPIFPLPFAWNTEPQLHFPGTLAETRADTGLSTVLALAAGAQIEFELEVQPFDRAGLARLLTLFAGRRGRCRALWLPSGREDFALAAPGGGTDQLVLAAGARYTAEEFPLANRRGLLVRDLAAGTWHARRVTAAVLHGNGTETLTLDAALPALPVEAALSRLYHVRADLDDLAVALDTPDTAAATLRFRELREPAAPAAVDGTLADDGGIRP